eukprot:g30776.t1
MKPEGTNTPQFYCLPKVHKPELPLRPIVSLPGTPSHRLSKELQRRLKHLFSKSPHSIHSVQEFLNCIKEIRMDDAKTMVSFGITALFTLIDIPLARETLATLLKQEQDLSDTICTENMLKLLDLCLTSHFTFKGQIYKQINGTPMGSPFSGLIAEAVMQRLESMALPQIQLKLWVRYMDDTFVIIKWTKLEETRKLINNTLTGIRFTKEEEKNKQLPFLDVMVECRTNGEFLTKKDINKHIELDPLYTPLRRKTGSE